MPKSKKRKTKLTKAEQLKIQQLKAKNCSITKICTALGISRSLWYTITNGKNGGKAKTQLEQSIKKGSEDRFDKIKNNCVDSLELLTRIHHYDEVKKKYAILRNPITGEQLSAEPELIEKTVTGKVVMPNATVTMFSSVNTMPEKFQSINKVEKTSGDGGPDKLQIEWV